MKQIKKVHQLWMIFLMNMNGKYQGGKMSLTENDFWDLIKDHVPGVADRVENSCCDGMPDIVCTYNITYWIELKVCSNKNIICDVTSLLRDSQKSWIPRHGAQGGLIFIFVRYKYFIVMYKWNHEYFKRARELKQPLDDAIRNSCVLINRIEKVSNRFNWESFTSTILKEITQKRGI
jgi:hypothetical protein